MKILITGGAGFIGSNLASYFVEHGHEVRIIDDLSSGTIENLESHIKDIEVFEEDILTSKNLDILVKESDVVYHLAALVGVRTTIEKPIETFEVNALGSKRVFETCYKYKVPAILTSSSEVYGVDVDLPLSEKSLRIYKGCPGSRWIYAQSKIIAEAYLLHYSQKGMRYQILRYFNCYGPNMTRGGYSSVVSKFFQAALNNKPITVYGDGTQTRSFVFIKDLVHATANASLINTWDITMNIGTQEEVSIVELAKKIKKVTKSKSQIIFVNPKEVLGKNFTETPKRKPEINRARTILDFNPKTSLDDGLHTTYMWFKKRQKFKRAA